MPKKTPEKEEKLEKSEALGERVNNTSGKLRENSREIRGLGFLADKMLRSLTQRKIFFQKNSDGQIKIW
jgi:hypothetical protein